MCLTQAWILERKSLKIIYSLVSISIEKQNYWWEKLQFFRKRMQYKITIVFRNKSVQNWRGSNIWKRQRRKVIFHARLNWQQINSGSTSNFSAQILCLLACHTEVRLGCDLSRCVYNKNNNNNINRNNNKNTSVKHKSVLFEIITFNSFFILIFLDISWVK